LGGMSFYLKEKQTTQDGGMKKEGTRTRKRNSQPRAVPCPTRGIFVCKGKTLEGAGNVLPCFRERQKPRGKTYWEENKSHSPSSRREKSGGQAGKARKQTGQDMGRSQRRNLKFDLEEEAEKRVWFPPTKKEVQEKKKRQTRIITAAREESRKFRKSTVHSRKVGKEKQGEQKTRLINCLD